MSEHLNYVDRCLAGDAFPDDIDDDVDRWHEGGTGMTLASYLGMEPAEYSLWVEKPEALRYIVAAHRQHRPVGELLTNSAFAFAARADDPDEAEKLVKWLERTGRLQ